MPLFVGFDDRIAADAAWQSEYTLRTTSAHHVAQRIHLVHVSGTDFPDFDRTFSRVTTPPHEKPVTSRERPSNTAQAEERLGIRPSVYFFAGRASPEFGVVAIAYSPEMDRDRPGCCTPFDSGGMASDHDHMKFVVQPSLDDRIALAKGSIRPLSGWRNDFGRYLAAYFSAPRRYWAVEGPERDLPDGLDRTANEWRAWTFEIRIHEGVSLLEHRAAWTATRGFMEALDRRMWKDPSPFLVRFRRDPTPLVAAGGDDYCEVLESWIRRSCNCE